MKFGKRILALCLAGTLIVGSLAGCKSKGKVPNFTMPTLTSAQDVDVAAMTDIYLTTAGVAADAVVAYVGDAEVTVADYLYQVIYLVDTYMQNYYYYGITQVPWDSKNEDDGPTMHEMISDYALDTAAIHAILPQLAKKENATADQNELAELEKVFPTMQQQLGSEAALRYYLWQQGLTKEFYTNLVTNGLLYSDIQEKHFGENGSDLPSDETVLAYAQDEGTYYKTKHILFKTVDDSDNEKIVWNEDGSYTFPVLYEGAEEEKLALATQMLEALNGAEDLEKTFTEMMAQHSDDRQTPESPANGLTGYFVPQGTMVKAYEEASLALQVGQMSQPVKSPYGYHIILRLEPDASDITDEIRNACLSSMAGKMQETWLEDNGVETTEVFEKLDLPLFYDNLQIVREALDIEIEAIQATVVPDSSDESNAVG